MEIKRPHSAEVIQKIVPPLAVWVVGQLLGQPGIRRAVNRLDDRIEKKRKRAERAAVRTSRTMTMNRAWLAAGVAAIATGVGLIARAATPKK
jgi:hypothetical protein